MVITNNLILIKLTNYKEFNKMITTTLSMVSAGGSLLCGLWGYSESPLLYLIT